MAEDNDIQVKSYQHVASIGGWAGAGRTLWAIGTVGAVAGALVGLLTPFAPLIVGAALPSLATIGTSVAAFAATGMSTGFAGGIMLGRISGTAAAVAEESERRSKEWTVRQIKNIDPNAHIAPDAPEAKPAKPSFKDTFRTYINPRVGLAMTVIGAVGGLIMGAAFLATGGAAAFAMAPALGVVSGLGAGATGAALMAYSAGVGAAFGALWSFNFPKITSKTTEFFGKLTGGELVGRKWEPEPAKTAEPQQQPAVDQPATEHAPRNFTSFQELVTRQTTVTHSLAKH